MTATTLSITTTTDGTGQNCLDRAMAAMAVFSELRAVIGTLHLQGCRDRRTGKRVAWAKPWCHHIWLVQPNGDHFDPSLSNLEHWARVQEIDLPAPLQELRCSVLSSMADQAPFVQRVISGSPTPGLGELVYLPGLVYASDVEELPPSLAYVSAWGRLARESVKAGGWDLAQLEAAMARVEGLLAQPPQIRSTAVDLNPAGRAAHRKAAKPKGRGFAQGVA